MFLRQSAQVRFLFFPPGGVEDQWDDFQAYLKSLGIDTMRQIYQDAYNAYYAE